MIVPDLIRVESLLADLITFINDSVCFHCLPSLKVKNFTFFTLNGARALLKAFLWALFKAFANFSASVRLPYP